VWIGAVTYSVRAYRAERAQALAPAPSPASNERAAVADPV
jgi:hypothetical protein